MPPDEDPLETLLQTRTPLTAAFYDTETKAITVVDRGGDFDDVAAVTTFAHESVHALQDREHDLAEFFGRYAVDDDKALATTAVFEGEATVYERMFADALFRATYWERPDDRWRAALALGRAVDAEAPFALAPALFPYVDGAAYVDEAWRHGTDEAVAELFSRPPVSTAQVMDPYRPDPSRSSTATWSPGIEAELPLPAAVDDFVVLRELVLGRWLLRVFAERAASDASAVQALTRLWRSDRFFALVRPQPAATGFVWAIRLRTGGLPGRAVELAALLSDAPEPGRTVHRGPWRIAATEHNVVLAGSDDPGAQDGWQEAAERYVEALEAGP